MAPLFFRKPAAPSAHFLHLGKTGGSAVKSALLDKTWPASFRIHCHPHEVRLVDIPEGDKVFFFVRDPIARFISGFLSRKRKGRPRYDVEWSRGEAEAFARFSTPEQLASSLAAAEPEAYGAMRAIGHVKTSYWDWFGDEALLRRRENDILFVGFTETLDADFARLKEKLGLPAEVKLPTDPILAHRTPANEPRGLSETSRAAIARWYEADYRFLEWARATRGG